MARFEASNAQKGYLIALARKAGHKIEMSDLNGVSTHYASEKIYQLKKELGEGGDADELNNMRRKLISMARTIGWQKENPVDPWKPLADMERLKGWCLKYGQHHKDLNALNKKELANTITQFEKVFAWELKKVSK